MKKKDNILESKFPLVAEVLKGIGQIMLQENIYTGIFFTIGIFLGSISMGISVLLATLVGTLTARALKYDKKEISMGLYGFSPALVGVALNFLFTSEIIIWLLVLVGAAAAAILQHFFIKRNIPVFTFPFILVSWILVTFLHHFSNIPPSEAFISVPDLSNIDNFTSETNGFGEVIFQGSIWAGILFFIGVYISSPIAALYGLVGSAISAAVSFHVHEPINQISMGLFSFNAVLCAIVFAGNRKIDGVLVLISVVLCVVINIFLVNSNIPVLQTAGGVFTFPFVLATCLILPLKIRKNEISSRINNLI
jgi:urea transporter